MGKNVVKELISENKRLLKLVEEANAQIEFLSARCNVIEQWHGQLNDDIITIVLADSAVMGKDTFGVSRIEKINAARDHKWDTYSNALREHAEADYLREDIDRRLKQIMKDKFLPWEKRYYGWEE